MWDIPICVDVLNLCFLDLFSFSWKTTLQEMNQKHYNVIFAVARITEEKNKSIAENVSTGFSKRIVKSKSVI